MVLSVKNKIRLGTIFLFLLLIVTGGSGIYYMAKLKSETKAVLQDNYESLSYCHTMQQQLNNLQSGYQQSLVRFQEALRKQNANITEPGEKKATNSLALHFIKLKSGDTARQTISGIQAEVQTILALNMNAIQDKNSRAQKTADEALTIIITSAGIVFLIAFTFVVNFPAVVTDPIRRLTEAIREISNKNYKYRIHIDRKDEFGKLADSFNEMAERLSYFESSNLNKILFEKSRAEAVINSLKDASIGIDKNNKILFANFRALQLLGLTPGDMIDKPVGEITSKNDLFRFLVENESSTPFKIVVDNRENYFTREVIEVEQEQNRSKVIVLKNITSFKELDVAKTNFIATISHELKTPLAASDFGLKLLEDERTGSLSAEQRELIGNLKQDNLRMLKILSELLNMSQVEAGRIQLNKQEVNPLTIVQNAIDTVAASAKDKETQIINKGAMPLPKIYADAEKTTWVVNNFLVNAIKYSPEHSTIEVTVKQVAHTLLFSVKDNGPGIATEYLPRLFERYFQVPGSVTKGTGLGLAISKDFIEAQGGKIWVESNIGSGTTFSFELPVD